MKKRLDLASVPPTCPHDQCHGLTWDSLQVWSNLDTTGVSDLIPPRGTRRRSSGLRFHDHQHARPFLTTSAGGPARRDHKHSTGSRILPLEDADLLPQGDELQSEVMSRAEEGTGPREKSQKKPDHGPILHDAVDRKAGSCKLLILRSNRILTTHSTKTVGLMGSRGLGQGWYPLSDGSDVCVTASPRPAAGPIVIASVTAHLASPQEIKRAGRA